MSLFLFILPLLGLGLGWEMVLFWPSAIWYWLVLVIVSATILSFSVDWRLPWRRAWTDRASFVVLSVSVFWWLLWLDFGYFNYAVPLVFWLLVTYFLRQNRQRELEVLSSNYRLAMFLSSTFFASSLSFGLVTVLGYPLYLVLSVFLLVLVLPAWSAVAYLQKLGANGRLSYWLTLLLLAELFTTLVWLPFAEITLGLLLTVMLLALYDLLKYFVNPGLIVRRIIVKKIIFYTIFLLLVLLSTPWF